MNSVRAWVFYVLVVFGIMVVRLSPDLRAGLQSLVSGYGLLALIVFTVLLVVIFRALQGRGDKHNPESHTPWWY